MNQSAYCSYADLGGQRATDAIVPEPEGKLFHADWEERVLALTLAVGACGHWNIDMSRSARETLPNYAELSYYQIWLAALEKLLLARGLVHPTELREGRMQQQPLPVARCLLAADVAATLARGAPTHRPSSTPARFSLGQKVRTREGRAPQHTRLPAYVAGRVGTVERLHGVHVFADRHAQGQGESPQHLYTVVFAGEQLWPEAAGAGHEISVDAWESYLEPA